MTIKIAMMLIGQPCFSVNAGICRGLFPGGVIVWELPRAPRAKWSDCMPYSQTGYVSSRLPQRRHTVMDETELERQARLRKSPRDQRTATVDQLLTNYMNEVKDDDPPQRAPTPAAGAPTSTEALLAENKQIKANLARCVIDLRRKNECLLSLRDNLQKITSLAAVQQAAIHRLNRVNRLQDELTILRQTTAETQVRQMDESGTLSDENRQLQERLQEQSGWQQQQQQQQQPTTEGHLYGIYFIVSALPSLFRRVCTGVLEIRVVDYFVCIF